MEPKTKSFPATFKSLGPDDNEPVGTFEAMVAVFDNVDKVGDRLKSTAFDNTLERWRQSGDPIPVILSHNWDDPFAIIGHADPNQVKAVEGRGLYVKGQIDHLEDNPVAAQVHRLMGSRLLKEFSFGYTVPAGGEKKADDGAYDLTEVNLIEVGPTLKGINPDTELLSLKSAVSAHNKRKSYVDIEIPGTFEAIRDSLSEAVAAKYPSPADPTKGWVSVNIVATTPSQVVYQVCEYDGTEKADTMYSASYELDADGNATLGEPSEVGVEITPKAEVYHELVKLALEYKALDQEEAEAWAQKMVDAEFHTSEESEVVEEKKDYTTAEREAMAKDGRAMPDGSFPIDNTTDLKNAIQSIGRAKDEAAAKRHIMKRARALGATDMIPDSWKSDEEIEIPEAEATEPEVKSDEIDSTLNELLLEQNEHEIGKALSADAMEAAALHRMLIVELSQFDEE